MTEAPYLENAVGNSGGWPAERQARVPHYKQQICEMLRTGLFVSEICEQLELNVQTVRKWRREDEFFETDYADAQSAYIDRVEKEAHRRAVEGVLEPVVSQGKLVTHNGEVLKVRKYSDPLMMFILKGHRREVYGDRSQVENTVKFDTAGVRNELARKLGAVAGASGAAVLPGKSD